MKSLQRTDISELRAMVEPPPAVRAVMEVICIMIDQEPNWKSAVAVLSDPLFVSKVLSRFNEHNRMSPEVLERIKQYISNNIPFEQAWSENKSRKIVETNKIAGNNMAISASIQALLSGEQVAGSK